MPTKYKRMPIQLEPEVDEVLTALAKLTRASKAGIVQGLLRDMLPALRHSLQVAEIAFNDRSEALKVADAYLLDSFQKLMADRSRLHTEKNDSNDHD